jgi:type II secretory pathway component PulF
MPTFAYVAKDKAGKIIRGRREADNEKALTKQLQESGFWVTQVAREGSERKGAKRRSLWLLSRK